MVMILLLVLSPVFAQMGGLLGNDGGPRGPGGPGEPGGPTGSVGDTGGVTDDEAETDVPTPGPLSSDVEPIGRVDDRLPHSECATCFTVPGLGDGRYQIFEKIESDSGEEILIPRQIPNPAPLVANEVRERTDEETGEDVWYIGTQGFIGPTDEEYWSDEAPLPTVDLQRIQMDYLDYVMGIEGVHQFGISPTGFAVSLLPAYAGNKDRIPAFLDGVPVEVELAEMATTQGHETVRFRPIPTGAGIVANQSGTLGPHVVRNVDNIGQCCQLWSLTAMHVVKPMNAPPPTPGTVAVYQPTVSASNLFGHVAHAFQLTPCDTVADPFCFRSGAPINQTYREPDVAAIDHAPFGDYHPSPFNDPEGTDPVRDLRYRHDRSVRGPSGRIVTPAERHRHKIWGAHTPAGSSGRVDRVGAVAIIRATSPDRRVYKICCVNRVKLTV